MSGGHSYCHDMNLGSYCKDCGRRDMTSDGGVPVLSVGWLIVVLTARLWLGALKQMVSAVGQ